MRCLPRRSSRASDRTADTRSASQLTNTTSEMHITPPACEMGTEMGTNHKFGKGCRPRRSRPASHRTTNKFQAGFSRRAAAAGPLRSSQVTTEEAPAFSKPSIPQTNRCCCRSAGIGRLFTHPAGGRREAVVQLAGHHGGCPRLCRQHRKEAAAAADVEHVCLAVFSLFSSD